MKKLLFILGLTLTFNLSAGNIATWECGDIIVTQSDKNTMTIGGLTYNMKTIKGRVMLYLTGRVMLEVKQYDLTELIIVNYDDATDVKTFIRCE